MARPRRNVEQVRLRILAEAKAIILEAGWEALTMVTLARRLDMSVGNLYKFFDSKDELFILIFTDFYDGLNTLLTTHIPAQGVTPVELARMVELYVGYGNERFNIYELVMHPPILYKDFIETPLQPLAEQQLNATMKAMGLAKSALMQALAAKGIRIDDTELQARFVFLFNSLHGLLLTMHSRIMPYIMFDQQLMIQLQLAMIQDTVLSPTTFAHGLPPLATAHV